MADEQSAAADVVIVGGGFSGTMLAAQLARRGHRSLIIEKAGRAGEGTAFSTGEPAHLLNVRTEVMSAWPDRLDDFDGWLRARGEEAGGFVRRMQFGAYLKEQLAEAVTSGQVRVIDGEAVRAEPADNGWTVRLDDGRSAAGRHLALALGNQPPMPLNIRGLEDSALVVDDPWSDEGRRLAEQAAAEQLPILIVGTGLTMVDMVLTLEAAGHDAPVTAVSRRGLLPRPHTAQKAPPLDGGAAPHGLASLWQWVRRQVAGGDDWRARVDSLRPRTAELWRGLSADERRRFMRHARPWWDVHRHRIAPQVAAQLKARIERGTLEIMAGRIVGAESRDSRAQVRIARRDGQAAVREAGLVMNCTGPLHALTATRDPLLRQMQDDGLIRPDPLNIGIDCDERDAATGSPGVWALGPLSKARRWEIIAVPDIRGQAEAVAVSISEELG
ncbi:FAD/NAD(P)-binding protein [Sphingomonas rhizophila]|uniref:FAD/NAD(P)-binding protein n=1 Tax=Sphingomonas rhizophila TaxID=2071607 RepID=A0A7G9SCD8_9SPHN|nr:FAD-dependent oxidoreductase [Sphingomonas rhizophila]QNN65513.1 FAD/NAD(P)-binding protein [Sphingomonas rhizophila]